MISEPTENKKAGAQVTLLSQLIAELELENRLLLSQNKRLTEQIDSMVERLHKQNNS